MSSFVTCEGTVSVDANGAVLCDGTWNTVDSAQVFASSQQILTPEDWAYVSEGLTWMFISAFLWVALIRLVSVMSEKEGSSDA